MTGKNTIHRSLYSVDKKKFAFLTPGYNLDGRQLQNEMERVRERERDHSAGPNSVMTVGDPRTQKLRAEKEKKPFKWKFSHPPFVHLFIFFFIPFRSSLVR